MENLKVSIVIPVHNGEKTLTQCLNSVLNQTYNNYEVIVVDNNSTDNTKKIIEDFQEKDKRVKYVFEAKQGRGAARNAGIKHAKGSIIAMTDSDCLVPKDWISKLIQPIIKENENIAMGYQKPLKKGFWQGLIQQEDWRFIKTKFDGNYIKNIDTKNFAIKANLIKKIMFDSNLKAMEDFDLYLKVKDFLKIRFLPQLKVSHNHKNSFSKVFLLNFDRGYWVTNIYFKHKKNKKLNIEALFESISLWNFVKFPFWLMLQFLKNPLKKSMFILIWETSWRFGIICALITRIFSKH